MLTVYIEKAEGLSARMHDAGFTRNMSVGGSLWMHAKGRLCCLPHFHCQRLLVCQRGAACLTCHPSPSLAPSSHDHACSKVKVSVGEVSKVTERSKVALLHRRDPVFNER